jgi:hypothetical protein
MLGTVGTAVAVLATAAVGLLMLSGRLPIRRGMTVVVGCFVLFSAEAIANALVTGADPIRPSDQVISAAAPSYAPARQQAAPYDPYAGASVPTATTRAGAEKPSR